MDGAVPQFLGSLLAVAALVALTYILGFRQAGKLESEAEARELFRLAPGGFEPEEPGLDSDGGAAIARDEQGRIAVLVPHGNQFVVRPVKGGATIIAQEGKLLIADMPGLRLHLGDRAPHWDGASAKGWAATDSNANRG